MQEQNLMANPFPLLSEHYFDAWSCSSHPTAVRNQVCGLQNQQKNNRAERRKESGFLIIFLSPYICLLWILYL